MGEKVVEIAMLEVAGRWGMERFRIRRTGTSEHPYTVERWREVRGDETHTGEEVGGSDWRHMKLSHVSPEDEVVKQGEFTWAEAMALIESRIRVL